MIACVQNRHLRSFNKSFVYLNNVANGDLLNHKTAKASSLNHLTKVHIYCQIKALEQINTCIDSHRPIITNLKIYTNVTMCSPVRNKRCVNYKHYVKDFRESNRSIDLQKLVLILFKFCFQIRLACSPRKLQFFVAPMNLVDLFAIVPFFLDLIIGGLQVMTSFYRLQCKPRPNSHYVLTNQSILQEYRRKLLLKSLQDLGYSSLS